MKQYYLNNEITSRQNLENGRSLITIMVDMGEDNYGESWWSDVELIVNNSDIKDTKIVPAQEIAQLEKQLREKRERMTAEIHEEILELKEKKQKIIKDLKKWEGLYEAFSFIDGECEYVVTESWNSWFRIRKFSEIKSGYRDNRLSAVVIRHSDERFEFKAYINEYSDGSGSDRKICRFFKTEDDAKEYVKSRIDKKIKVGEKTYHGRVKMIKELGLESDNITDYLNRAKQEERESQQKKIEKLKKELEKAQSDYEAI